MKTLRKQYQEVEINTINKFDELVKLRKEFLFEEHLHDEEFEEEFDDCITVGLISSSDGSEYYVKLLSVSNDGLYVAEENDFSNKQWVELSDLSTLYWRIEVCNTMEEYIERDEQ